MTLNHQSRAILRHNPMEAEVSCSAQKIVNRIRHFDYAVVLFSMVLIPSTVVQSLLGMDEKTTFALFAPIILIASLGASRQNVHRAIPMLIFLFMLTGALAAVVASSFSQLLMGASLAVAAITGRQVFATLNNSRLLRAVSWFSFSLLVGGVIGIVYGALGGSPLLDVQVGYRTTHLYLTTFSFAFIGDFIRPSGIFDEPGSLVMYVAIVTMFNDTLRQNLKLNLVLMALMVFTGSLAGVALLSLFLVSSSAWRLGRKKGLSLLSILLFGFIIVSIVAPRNIIYAAVNTFYSDRLQIVDGRLAGDNRSNQVSDFFELVDAEMLLRGAKNSTRPYDTEDMSSNPFSIVFGYGLIISLPYFCLLLWLVVITIKNRFHYSYTSLGLLFLLLQRPYVYNMSWSILIAAAVWLLYQVSRERRSRKGVPR